MYFINHPFKQTLKSLQFESTPVFGHFIRDAIVSHFGCDDFLLWYNGKKLQDEEIIPENATLYVTFALPGGKGGFGSMLRAIGAQIEKTTNREACRDLSGRRLRDINEEQRIKNWIAKEAEREAEKLRRRQARIERLKSKPSHKFFDFEYEKEISELPNRVNDALSEGLQKVKQPTKRPAEAAGSSKPPNKTWLADEFSSCESDSESNNPRTESPPKKRCIEAKDSDSNKPFILCSKTDSQTESEDSLSQPGTSTFKEEMHVASDESSASHSSFSLVSAESSISQPRVTSKDDPNLENFDTIKGDSESCCSTDNSNSVIGDKIFTTDLTHNELSNKESHKVEVNENSNMINAKSSDYHIIQDDGQSVEKIETKDLISKDVIENVTEFTIPITLSDFQDASEIEKLGLEKLKSELMIRGLKCGGTLTDRAQRLWKVRNLQPHEYPANLLAKSKK